MSDTEPYSTKPDSPSDGPSDARRTQAYHLPSGETQYGKFVDDLTAANSFKTFLLSIGVDIPKETIVSLAVLTEKYLGTSERPTGDDLLVAPPGGVMDESDNRVASSGERP